MSTIHTLEYELSAVKALATNRLEKARSVLASAGMDGLSKSECYELQMAITATLRIIERGEYALRSSNA